MADASVGHESIVDVCVPCTSSELGDGGMAGMADSSVGHKSIVDVCIPCTSSELTDEGMAGMVDCSIKIQNNPLPRNSLTNLFWHSCKLGNRTCTVRFLLPSDNRLTRRISLSLGGMG